MRVGIISRHYLATKAPHYKKEILMAGPNEQTFMITELTNGVLTCEKSELSLVSGSIAHVR